MEEIFRINSKQKLKFNINEFKVTNKEDDQHKFVGQLIADYVTSSIDNFKREHRDIQYGREFFFISNDFSNSDSFSEAKKKIGLFSYKFNNDNEFNFIIYFFKLIKDIEDHLVPSIKPRKDGYFTYIHSYGKLVFTFKFYPDSKMKLVTLEYKGNKLVEFTEYMDFGIKLIKYVHPIFSTWDIKIGYDAYSHSSLWTAYLNGIKMDTIIVSRISELEKYVVSNMSLGCILL